MSEYPQLQSPQGKTVTATIKTTKGDIVIELFPELAPKTVENFTQLAKAEYYNGIIFHRVIPDFMIQSGDPSGTGYGGRSIWGQPFEDEFSDKLFHFRGALSMANAGVNTNGSQFFIVTQQTIHEVRFEQLERAGFPAEIIEAYKEKGGSPGLDGRHTVFGQVREGLDVAEAISQVERTPMDKPVEDVVIQEVIINEEDK